MDPSDSQEPTAPDNVEQHAHYFFKETRLVVGDRFAEARYNPDRGLRVTIIDLNDQDTTAITNAALELGILDWVRIDRADPAALATWERLRHDLQRLESAKPRVLRQYPTPEPGYRRPPVCIDLSADAQPTAADLYRVYGDFVSLRVGTLPYPPAAHPVSATRPMAGSHDRQAVNPAEMRVVPEAPLAIRSGQTTTHALLFTNLSDQVIRVHTNGNLTATIVDDTGVAVGGFAGAQRLPLVIVTIGPSETVRIPVLVGTASYTSELGYAIPPGTWHLSVPFNLADGRRLETPALEMTVTS